MSAPVTSDTDDAFEPWKDLLGPHLSVKLSNHRAFGDEPEGFPHISQINVLVGRNNVGKSSLLDAVTLLSDPKNSISLGRGPNSGRVILETRLELERLQRHFPTNVSGGPIPGNHWHFASQWLDKVVVWSIGSGGSRKLIELRPPVDGTGRLDVGAVLGMFQRVVDDLEPPFLGQHLLRVLSDRDIRPEADLPLEIQADGRGATTAIRMFLTAAKLNRDLVRVNMLTGLNEVFMPEAVFEEIEVQEHDNGEWEVFLGTPDSRLIPLSNSGSGLRTVLLVLCQLHLTPEIIGKPLESCVVAFEELENNLHPALQRRLMRYVRSQIVANDMVAFITTHSHAVIDLFATDELATITHVTSDGTVTRARPVVGHPERSAVLDDLDVRASDLLQANGIIWVEGPSDRTYVNRWIELVSEGTLREGTHFQCVFYGGSLLAHLTAVAEGESEEDEDHMRILKVNRNAVVLMDSDRGGATDPINAVKERIVDEVEAVGGSSWVTHGRTIENYLSPEPLAELLGVVPKRAIRRFEHFDSYLDRIQDGEGRRFLRSKPLFAARLVPHLSIARIDRYDLVERTNALVAQVRGWNRL